jgi:hypothetical protein
MHATNGDWLLVAGRTDHDHERMGLIMSVRSASGEPPYSVHWLDTDQDALVFPGPDALVLTDAQVRERERAAGRQDRVFAAPPPRTSG